MNNFLLPEKSAMDDRNGLKSAISKNENEREYEYNTEFMILCPKKFTVSFKT
jgi:hypothetical protein